MCGSVNVVNVCMMFGWWVVDGLDNDEDKNG